jgi:hypothetical protein
MFLMTMPTTFAIGATAPVTINGQDTTLTWRDATTLVIGGTDARRILDVRDDDGLRLFICGDTAGAADRVPAFTIITLDAVGRPVELVLANLAPEADRRDEQR